MIERVRTELTIVQAFAQGRELRAPFTLMLSANKTLQVETILRSLPGKRLVVKTVDAGKTVVAKIFLHQRNLEQEIAGYRLMEKANINTPQLLSETGQGAGGCCFYEYLDNAQSLDGLWNQATMPQKENILRELLGAVKKMFETGIYQADLHLGNFVYAKGIFYTLDPASCVQLTEVKQIQQNLALLLAQFSLRDQPQVIEAIKKTFPAISTAALDKDAGQLCEKRKNDYLKKIFRNCTDVAELKIDNVHIWCRRDQLTEKVKALLVKLDTAIDGGKTIKHGRSTTVAVVSLDGKKYVVKRYHNANTITALRRRFGKNRATNNWYFAHLLGMLGIKTPMPLALVKISNNFLDYRSYYVSEYIEADNAFNVFTSTPPTPAQLKAISDIFADWRRAGIEHGDCKATNWIVSGDEVQIVDLDAMCETQNPGTTDRVRFLRDWENHPALYALFESLLCEQKKK